LSDNGGCVKQLYDSSFPLPPYYDFRFSNGPVWIESFPTKDTRDYAYGGAVVNQSASNNGPPSLMAQVNDYLISNHFNLTAVADETQYDFCGGSNDIFGAPLSNETLTAQGVNGDLAAMAVELPLLIGSQIRKLITAGATNILVMLLPSISDAPIVTQFYSSIQRQFLSKHHHLLCRIRKHCHSETVEIDF
jgi:phospholipase/lecithinase/hemolysin